ncbi:MAG: hypothetical protein QOK38_2423 [Acidobacteriaceae bacterium]|nr:hypothetical protein [Acidobacteriaceae bacterium]
MRTIFPAEISVRFFIMLYIGLALLLLAVPGLAQDAPHKHGGSSASGDTAATANRFGTVQFTTSCAPSQVDDFNGAVALLHSFEYEEARAAFIDVLRKDPKCAMARWGESMTYFHGLWSEYNAASGAQAAAAARRLAADNPQTSDREKMYIAAISEIFTEEAIKASQSDDNQPDHSGYSQPARAAELKYTERMAELHKQYPADKEATIFYALALDISAKRSDKTHADIKQCTALLKPLFVEMPNHPGVAHYIIHCDDNPEMASEGLEAARKYAQIAPASTHATHMPSHIFAQLGLWNEMVDSNRASLKAAEQSANAASCEKIGNAIHAMDFLVVALIETGRMQEARDVLDHANKITSPAGGGDRCGASAKSEVFAAYALETGEWEKATEIKVDEADNSPIAGPMWMAVGIGAARTGDAARAHQAERQLTAMRDARSRLPGQTLDNSLEPLRLAVAGWQAQRAGDKKLAREMLRKGADLQDQLGSNYTVIKPVREMLADLLLLNGDQAGALAEYKAVLVLQPNRFNSVYGAGSAAFATGDAGTAKAYYKQLLAFANGDERPQLATARARITEMVAERK